MLASQRQVEGKVAFLRQQEADWNKRAELALLKGEEGLAREALKRKQVCIDMGFAWKGYGRKDPCSNACDVVPVKLCLPSYACKMMLILPAKSCP